jgi:hypothetical protein
LKILLAAILAAHALIHTGYLTPAPPRTAGGPEWPFELGRSWLVSALGVDPGIARVIGATLVIATVAVMIGAALATLGWIVPTSAWPVLTVAGAVASTVTLLAFFHPWIVLGIAIDAVLLWTVVVVGWTPADLGA